MVKNFLGVIPARMKSTRFPGKPLAKILNIPMVQWVYEAASKCTKLDHVVVATDSIEIFEAVKEFNGEAVMTSADCHSGLDRIIETAQKISGFTHYVNIQGDEPMISHLTIEGVINLFYKYDYCEISTAAVYFKTMEEFQNTNNVKVVINKNQKALYFSRSMLPNYERSGNITEYFKNNLPLKHQGIYAYSKEILSEAASLKPCVYEKAESLEQLRFLHNGYDIYVDIVENESIGVDTPDDLLKVESILKAR